MNRHELEHLIRASGAITEEYEFVVIGSQSILGKFPILSPNSRCLRKRIFTQDTRLHLRIKLKERLEKVPIFIACMAFTLKVWVLKLRFFLGGGRNDYGRCKTGIRTVLLGGVWMLMTCLCPRPLQPGQRTRHFVWGSCDEAM